MAKKKSGAENFIGMVSLLPWQVGLVLAVISFFVLHVFSETPVSSAKGLNQLGSIVVSQMIRTFAGYGQYVLPFFFSLGALLSFVDKSKKNKLNAKVAETSDGNVLLDMSWQEFELLNEGFFSRRGYKVTRTGGSGPDGGVDLILKQGTERYFVQCKQWRAQKVGVSAVREFYGVMTAKGAAGGFFISAGEYTKEAHEFVKGLNLKLINGAKIHQMIREVNGKPKTTNVVRNNQTTNKICDKCGNQMLKRVAKKGKNIGAEFWGCSGYPKCKNTMAVT